VYLLVFHAYIKEMHSSRSKIPSKTSRQPALRGGFNSGVKGLTITPPQALLSEYLTAYFPSNYGAWNSISGQFL
jgi:hypothetical protein